MERKIHSFTSLFANSPGADTILHVYGNSHTLNEASHDTLTLQNVRYGPEYGLGLHQNAGGAVGGPAFTVQTHGNSLYYGWTGCTTARTYSVIGTDKLQTRSSSPTQPAACGWRS